MSSTSSSAVSSASASSTTVVTSDHVQYRLSSQVPMIAPKIIAQGPGYIELELSKLTPEEKDLYFEIWCTYCGCKLKDQEEYNNTHSCSSRQAVRAYYKQYD